MKVGLGMAKEGRPAKYETPEELEKAIETYFESCVAEPLVFNGEVIRDARGNPVMNNKVPTTAGLALYLGYADRQSLYDQKGRSEEFSCIIKRAITAIEVKHEEAMLTSSSPTGSIFWLKNHRWADKQELEHSGDLQVVNVGLPKFLKEDK